MIDFYDELNLDEDDSISDINSELKRLELVWERRLVSKLEVAQKKLDLIEEAKKVFQSDESREQYDKALYEFYHPKTDGNDAERKENFKKYTCLAKEFLNKGELDLAKGSLEKALNYASDDLLDFDFYVLAAEIYIENSKIELGLDYINKAIILEPRSPKGYFFKAMIYKEYYSCDYSKILKTTEDYAVKANDKKYQALAYDELAVLYYKNWNDEKYIRLAQENAEKALSINPELKQSNEILEKINRAKEEKKRREEERKERLRREETARKRKKKIAVICSSVILTIAAICALIGTLIYSFLPQISAFLLDRGCYQTSYYIMEYIAQTNREKYIEEDLYFRTKHLLEDFGENSLDSVNGSLYSVALKENGKIKVIDKNYPRDKNLYKIKFRSDFVAIYHSDEGVVYALTEDGNVECFSEEDTLHETCMKFKIPEELKSKYKGRYSFYYGDGLVRSVIVE